MARMGASTSTSYHHNAPPPLRPYSSTHTNPKRHLSSSSSSNSPAPAPLHPFLTVGTRPSTIGNSNRWCWLCGSDSSERYSKINLRERATDGSGGIEIVSRVLCGGCSAWRKEWRRDEMEEEDLVGLTAELVRRGEGIRRREVERVGRV